jgi:hypothetical protein
MDNQALLYIMTAFVVIAGLSLLLQLFMLYGIFRSAKATEQKLAVLIPKVEGVIPKVEALVPKVESLIGSSQTAVDQSRQQIRDVAAKTHEILDLTKRQLVVVEGVLNDASSRAKVQLEHAELVLDDTMSRAHETLAMVHNGINRPLREIQGITAGVRTALAYLARGSRPTPDAATHDDEMFI